MSATNTKNGSFQRLPVKGRTLKQVKILAALTGEDIYALVGRLVDSEWRRVQLEGLVNDRMLEELPEPVVYAQSGQE